MPIEQGVPAAVYHKRELGVVSKSALDLIQRSPAHFKHWVDGNDSEPTPAMQLGTMVHTAVLEPALFAATHALMPDFGDRRYKLAKENHAAWVESHRGLTCVSQEDYATIQGIQSAVRAHPAASRLLNGDGGLNEVTLRWVDAESGLQCKARADRWIQSKRVVVDLKTCEDASPAGFARSVVRYRYAVQAAVYSLGFDECGERADHFVFVAMEKLPPFAVGVYVLDSSAVERGMRDARSNITTMKRCIETDTWSAYGEGISVLELPKWYTSEGT